MCLIWRENILTSQCRIFTKCVDGFLQSDEKGWDMFWRMTAILILLVFYGVYIGKMVIQTKRGIRTDQIAKGKKRDKVFYIELLMKIATYSVILIEVVSISWVKPDLPVAVIITGALLGVAGDMLFAIAVVTMKDSWRAGIAEEDNREMITSGIYKISRNPAFLGFDCVYLGILLMFFNWILLFFSVFAAVMLHLQILQEEEYLPTVFGEDYISYKKCVSRYLGRIE